MKKRFFSLFVCAALLLSILFSAHTAWADSSSGDGDTYTDPKTGATFVVPEGWTVDTINLEEAANFYQVKYVSQKDPGSSFLYSSADLWSSMSESKRSGHTRSEIDSAYIYEEGSMLESLVNLAPDQGITIDPSDIRLVTFGEKEFIEIPEIQEMAGIRISTTLFWYIENGYSYNFPFGSTSDQATQDFHSVLSSLQIPPAEASGSGSTGSGQSDEMVETYKRLLTNSCLFLLELGVTFLLYALPFVIYRNAIRKRPVNKKVLVLILIILYELVTWILFNGALFWFIRRYANIFIPFFWGWYSYRRMVRGKDTDDLPESAGGSAAPQQPVKADTPHIAASYARPQNASAAPARPFNADAPAAQQPAAYVPAAATPAVPAPVASQTPSAAPTVPSTPAASVPPASAPQTPPPPVTYAPAPAAAQTPPVSQRGTSVPSADPASMWPAQYHSAQDMRAGFPKQGEKVQVATPVPLAPQAFAASPAATPAAPFVPTSSASAAPVPQTPPAAQRGTSAPAASDASMWPTQYHSAQDMRAGFPKHGEKAQAARPVPPAPQTYADAPFIPAASTPVAATSAASTPAVPTSAVPALQTPPSSVASVPASAAPSAPTAATPSMPVAAVSQAPPAPRIQFCRNCGFRLLEDSKFCSSCGTPVVPTGKG